MKIRRGKPWRFFYKTLKINHLNMYRKISIEKFVYYILIDVNLPNGVK